MKTRPARTGLAAVLALGLLASACSDDDGGVAASGRPAQPSTTEAEPAEGAAPEEDTAVFPVTVTADNGEVIIEAEPEAIVSLSPTATEMLFAIGAGDQVKAVDDQSNFPVDVPVTELSGFEPNIEAIAGYEPDLVVVANDPGDLAKGLTALGIPTLLLGAAATLDDTYEQIELLGQATGHDEEAGELAAEMEADIEELAASVASPAEPVTYYHELDNTLYSVTSKTFVGQIYSLAGLQNVADAADPDGAAGGYPQLSAEFLVAADPDLIFLADTKCCGQSAETLAERPGFDQLTAVKDGRVIELDDDVASRWGPRVVDLLEAVVEATAAVRDEVG